MVDKPFLDLQVSEVELATEEEIRRIRRKIDWRLCTIAGKLAHSIKSIQKNPSL